MSGYIFPKLSVSYKPRYTSLLDHNSREPNVVFDHSDHCRKVIEYRSWIYFSLLTEARLNTTDITVLSSTEGAHLIQLYE